MHDKIKTPLIGITARTMPNDRYDWGPNSVGQFHTYVEAVIAGGGVPVILPTSLDDNVIRLLVDTCDGFLFAGGDDIDPTFYGEKNLYSTDIDQLRDEFELRLLRAIDSTDKPILTICRGTQILNIARGGNLYQDLPAQLPGSFDHRHTLNVQDYTILAHEISIVPGSRLHGILQTSTIETNSQHHQAVKQLGTNLVVNARTKDNVIEGIEDPKKPFVIGVQSHPETLFSTTEHRWALLFEQFIEACRGWYLPISSEKASDETIVSQKEIELEPAQTIELASK